MPKIKVKRKSTFIDMTAMSDVTVLLLTFFMLTSTFLKKEPVMVKTPGSVSEIKIPETNILQILVSPDGKVFMSLDQPSDRIEVLKKMGENYGITFTDKELKAFSIGTSFGVPIESMKQFLALPSEDQDKILMKYGIPLDTTETATNQFRAWVQNARAVNDNLVIAIKADEKTPYPCIKNIMGSLQSLKENRYNLITALREVKEPAKK